MATLETNDSHSDCVFDHVYTLDRVLQKGSYGTVHLTVEKSTGNQFAVKVIDRKKLRDDTKAKTMDAEIHREVQVMRELSGNCRGVIELIRFFEEPNTYYMVMELAAGGDLFDKLASMKQSYTEQDARDLAWQLLESIQYLHCHNIVHRDLKPENLLLLKKNDTRLKLADFGFARKIPPKGYLTTKCGTASYIAPEILVGDRYGKSVDVWSTGVILFMMIGGYPPFQASNHRKLFRKIRSANFCFDERNWKTVSVEAKQLITGLLTVNTSFRTTVEAAMESSWIRYTPDMRLNQRDLRKSLTKIAAFRAKEKLKGAVYATNWAMTAKFWEADKLTFTHQLHKWDVQFEELNANDNHDGRKLSFSHVYELKQKIRQGSTATVWTCLYKPSQTMQSVKIVNRDGLTSQDDEDVLNEVALLQSLKHDGIVQLKDFYEEDDAFYIVTEYMRGGDVFDRINSLGDHGYTEKDARDLIRTLLKTVAFIHSQGVAHRDLKPQNLLLQSVDDDADIKVTNFGFAKRVHTPQSLVSRCGTPIYVAPEILKNAPHDEAVDMWSVGAIIHVLLVGYPPFRGETRDALFQNIMGGAYDLEKDDKWSRISQQAKDLVRALLVVNPVERITAQEALRSDWMKEENDVELATHEIHIEDDDILMKEPGSNETGSRNKWKTVATTVRWLSMSKDSKPVSVSELKPVESNQTPNGDDKRAVSCPS